ncbi:MAG: serine/threonine-protein kinase [Kofleriaceae bacterium]
MTRYEVIERIGAGRMAEIFRGRAIAAGGFEKPVAIKRILPHLSSDPRFVELLIAEAKLLSVLRHRNIVQIFDVGVGDDAQHFLVMEYVDGVDLGALQRHLEATRQRLPIDLVLHLGAEVCEALDHAQQVPDPDGRPLGLVHRDVTPSNVLVSRSGEVKLTDFGLAKRPEDGTSAGGLRGRFGYVSPEQAAGLPVDARADVFAVAVIMWELALGRRLFSGLADFDALRAVRDTTIAPVRDLDPTLPADLDAILREALARAPDHRLPDAGELGKRLRGLRYSLDDSSGDPASALARLVVGVQRTPLRAPEPPTVPGSASAAASELPSHTARASSGFEAAEPTVIRIRTADAFADDDGGTGILNARRIIDRFEEDETRMSRLPAELAAAGLADRDSRAMPVAHAQAPLHLPPDPTELAAPLTLDPPRPRLRPPTHAGGRERHATPPPTPTRAPRPPTAAPPPPPRPPPAARGTEPVEAPPASAYPAPVLAAPRAPLAPSAPVPPQPLAAPYQPPQRVSTAAPYPPPAAPARPRPFRSVMPPPQARWWLIAGAALVIAVGSFFATRAALEPGALPTTAPAVDAGVDAAPRGR